MRPRNTIFSIALSLYLTLGNGAFCQEISSAGTAPATVPPHPVQPLALTPFSTSTDSGAPAPWRVVGLPGHKVPLARFSLTRLDGERVVELATRGAYGTWVHDLPGWTPGPSARLRWRWRLDEPVPGADLKRKEADDAALKLCVMFDPPLDGLPFGERALLRLARAVSGEPLPAATLCYVWDPALPAGTVLPNAYTRRMRWMVVDGATSPLASWRSHSRPVAADYLKAFGDESRTVPPVAAIVLGADSDNTASHSLGRLGDVTLTP